ncbi:MAG: hypothetical protein Q8O67_31940 [Deltaproteobacteria bacterium]|nr:hypothetical protein [Deltaproteobacteria bacterium]
MVPRSAGMVPEHRSRKQTQRPIQRAGLLGIAREPRNAPWLARFDAALEPSWVRRYDPGQEGIVTAIATVPGGVAAVGWFRGGLDVDDVHLGSAGGTAYQPFAVVVEPDGDLVRASSLAAADQAMALTATSNGQRLLVGGVAAEDLVLADGRTLAASPFAAFVVDERLLIRGVVGR